MVASSDIFRLEIPWREPIAAFAPLAEQPWSVGFFSLGNHPLSRWSILCADPDEVFVGDGEKALSQLKIPERIDTKHTDLPFCGGLAGLLSYELGLKLENLAEREHTIWPDLAFGNYPCCALFDHDTKRAWVIGPDIETAQRFSKKLGERNDLVSGTVPLQDLCAKETDAQMMEKIGRTIDYIKAGDIFQANISREFKASLRREFRSYDLFQQMAELSHAPFCASFRLDENRMVLSNSPERFLKVDANGQVQTHPIKGTRVRGETRKLDILNREELLQSAKDRAENLMIVDLMRNDLSRVCVPGSVKVPELFAIQSFANVHHLVSTIEGQLREQVGPVDLLRATFPPGSITGAPKIRAMQIIHELEVTARGAYCGALGFISRHGAMDFNVLIRTLQLQKKRQQWEISFRAGSGIVADSDPKSETQEMHDKASIFTKLSGEYG